MPYFPPASWDDYYCLINFHHSAQCSCALSGRSKGDYVPLDRLGQVRGANCPVRLHSFPEHRFWKFAQESVLPHLIW